MKKDNSDLRLEIVENGKKLDSVRSELKNLHKDYDKLKGEHYIISKRMHTIEMEHKVELKAYEDEIENLQLKLKDAQKKTMDLDNSNSGLDDSGNLLGEEFLTIDRVSNHSGDIRARRTSISNGLLGALSGTRERRKSIVSGLPNAGLGGAQNALIVDMKVRELTDKIAESHQIADDTKLLYSKTSEELAEVSKKLREEIFKAEILKKKLEMKEEELEELRTKFLVDNEKYSVAINDVNEELDKREEQLYNLKKKLRNAELLAQRPVLPASQQKIALPTPPPPKKEEGIFSSLFK